jgi:O-antigen/teichoic acid export membrane protein
MRGARRSLTVAFAATSALNYVFSLAMGWLLLPGDFGTLAFAQTVILVVGLVLQGGFPWSLARSMALGDAPADALIRGAVTANTALGLAVGAALMALFWSGPLSSGFETTAVAALVAASCPLLAFAGAARGAVQGAGNFRRYGMLQVVEVTAKALLGVLLVIAGFGVAGAIWGFLLGSLAAAVLGLVYVRGLGVRAHGAVSLPALGAAGGMLGTLLAVTLLLNWGLLMVKLFADDRAAAGLYQAALVLANAPYFLVSAVIAPVLFVDLAQHGTAGRGRRVLADALRRSLIIVVPLELALFAAPGPALAALLPDAYSGASDTLRVLAVGNVLIVVVLLLSVALRAIGSARAAVRGLLPVVLIQPVPFALVVPAAGPVGAAVVFTVASTVALVVLGVIYSRIVPRPEATESVGRATSRRWAQRRTAGAA